MAPSAASGGHRTDVAIIGGGPVGMFAVFECGMLGMHCHVIDALEAAGGQCTALYPEKPIYDIPGYPRIMAGELVDKLLEQAAPFKPTYHFNQQVTKLARQDGGWLLETSKGTQVEARGVIVAAGVGAFGPNRPPLAGLEAFEATGAVRYLVQRREDMQEKRLVIAGGGDSALDWALLLAPLAKSLALVHRRAKFRAAPDSVAKMQALVQEGRIDLVVPYQLAGLEGSAGVLRAVVVKDLDGNERRLDADVLLAFYGLSQNLGPIAEWGLSLERNLIKVDPATFNAGQPGLFAIGDIVTYPGKLKLILTGFAEAAVAAHAAYKLVFPDKELHFEYSTTKGIPGLA
jgi:thioredoxin reductase (NADPH)